MTGIEMLSDICLGGIGLLMCAGMVWLAWKALAWSRKQMRKGFAEALDGIEAERKHNKK
jgi:hypothetical protein